MNWLAIIVIIILLGIGYYVYAHPSIVSSVLGSVSSLGSPSIQQIEANASKYLGQQVTESGTLDYSNSFFTFFNYSLTDNQGYIMELNIPNNNNRVFFNGDQYTITGTVGSERICMCPSNYFLNNSTAIAGPSAVVINSKNPNPTCGDTAPPYENIACPISNKAYLNVTSATLQQS